MYGEYRQVKRLLFSVNVKTPFPHLGGQGSIPGHFTRCVFVCVCYVEVAAFLLKIIRNFLSTNYATIVPCVLCVIVWNWQKVIEISFLVWVFASDSSREQNQNKEVNLLLDRCIFLLININSI